MTELNENFLAEQLFEIFSEEEQLLADSQGLNSSRMYGEKFCQYLLMRRLLLRGFCVTPERDWVDLTILDGGSTQQALTVIELKGPWRIKLPGSLPHEFGTKLLKDFRKLDRALVLQPTLSCFSVLTLFGEDHELFEPWLKKFIKLRGGYYSDRLTRASSNIVSLNRISPIAAGQTEDRSLQVFVMRLSKQAAD